MKVVAMIPARLQATRFPEKLIQDLNGQPVIYRTVENAIQSGLFDEVIVVADDEIFKQLLAPLNIQVHITTQPYQCGSDRIASVADQYMHKDILINIQGDEPFINTKALKQVIHSFQDEQVKVASLVHPLDEKLVHQPNFVKVAMNKNLEAIFFSRAPIPYRNQLSFEYQYFRHIGIYAFRPEMLVAFAQWEIGDLEQMEQIEALRFIENGVFIQMSVINELTIGIDTPEDLEKARELLKN
ncbi:MAG TPA: 3-deoxy-manno-octulosonate cytidylyltransferase [Chitinophagaceae bacterium]|nr:3-deoxy-manno-octulosonate cytidylyltransferase [Chitinophagaceae bacterium]